MMNGFPAKSAAIAALLVVLLLLGAFPAASAFGGGEHGSRTLSGREGCFGDACQRKYLFHNNKDSQMLALSLRKLQQSRLQPPPAPSKNGFHIWSVPPAPPPPAQY